MRTKDWITPLPVGWGSDSLKLAPLMVQELPTVVRSQIMSAWTGTGTSDTAVTVTRINSVRREVCVVFIVVPSQFRPYQPRFAAHCISMDCARYEIVKSL